MNATREHFGLAALDPALIYSYVGNGAAVLVRRTMGASASDETVHDALAFFLRFYRVHALEHTKLYPGVNEVVRELAAAEHKLAILTNKPVRISFDIIRALGLEAYFMRVYGGDSFPAKKPDPIGVFKLMREAGVTESETLLIGDSGVDVQTARNAGIRSCGVEWGFQPEAFEAHPPDMLIQDPRQLLEQLSFLTFQDS